MNMLRWGVILPCALLAVAAKAPDTPRPPGAVSCIDSQRYTGHRSDGKDTIIFTSGLRTYRNHLRTECPGVEKLNSTFGGLATEPWGSQLCEGDFVRVFDTTGVRSVGLQAYPRCVLGWFEPMPNEPRQSKPSKP
jgi:hypothetical protein